MSAINYSKWDHIEVSDDEDDTHPNIDTASLFRWRHQARLEKDAAWKVEKQEFETSYKEFLKRYNDCKEKIQNSEDKPNSELVTEMAKLENEAKEWQLKEVEIKKKERLRPLNVDTINKDGVSKTVINTANLDCDTKPTDNGNSEDSAVNRLKDHVEKYGKKIKKFGLFQRPLDTQEYLIKNPFLVFEETVNHLVLWCIELAMEEKIDLMNHVSHQCILMLFMLELAKSLKCDPKACIRPFFAKFINPEPEYLKAFNEELEAFRERIKVRAKVRLEEAMLKLEEEEREKRLGPGGLDPVEVFESLPQEMQDCFEKKDVEQLKTVLSTMEPSLVEYHMKRCVDSGLWVDNVNQQQDKEAEESCPIPEDNDLTSNE